MEQVPVIIDTDVGPDDLLAIGYLLNHPEVQVEAFTVAYGLAHATEGSRNLCRMLAACGKKHIPVFVGADRPMQATAPFPGAWRSRADKLPGVRLPDSFAPPQSEPATSFLRRRAARASDPVCVLALGALTNLAGLTLEDAPGISRVVSMGGAVDVPGNLVATDDFSPPNTTAEWNYFVDPLAAQIVLRSNMPVTVIPLDSTDAVPITPAFIDRFDELANGTLATIMSELLALVRPFAAAGKYFAWDPLAAVFLTNPEVVHLEQTALEVTVGGPDAGTLRRTSAGPIKSVATSADAQAFKAAFLRNWRK